MVHLIVIICNNGNAELVMSEAKAAGARGGTILHARGSADQNTVQFIGITIQPEKEMVLILTTDEDKNNIMKSVNVKLGPGTEAHAVCFSLPVDGLMGVQLER